MLHSSQGSSSLNVIGIGAIWQITCHFLLVLHCNYVLCLRHYQLFPKI